ncbi:MAG TPA: DUF72 domain-containing protein [Chloroflexota bacterium]|nr:DUF72 domain-containing protein [Chloroflexota bacterium]
MAVPPLRIGTSGWNYKHWRGIFYPRDLPAARWLDFYCQHFDTVEINYSFYRLPSRDNFAAWAEQAPPGFLFAVKGNRFITHLKRLREPDEPLGRFFERASALGPTFGPVLWQLPPQFHCDVDRLRAFLAALPRDCQHAFEFRHDSWFVQPVYDALAAHDAALCLADRGGGNSPLEITASWTYVRFHGGLGDGWAYTDAQLCAWAERLGAYRARGLGIYAYFNNDPHGHAITDARRLRALLTA